ncbi:MAG: hypothetical protein Q9216_004653 [Gyalolechia sp. 2 TL-2023]
MRFVDNIAQCTAQVTILADGRECPEYSITGDEHGNLKCYIPLMSDQQIAVQVAMDMNAEHFEVDLFTDGVLRNFWQSTHNSVNKHRAPNVEFTQGIYRTHRSLYRSNMSTAVIPDDASKAETLRTNIGTIEIMINKQDRDRHLHYHGCMVPDDVPKNWYNQAVVPTSATLQPSLQMMFRDGTRLQEADRGGTRLRLKRTRQGEAPWATFKFIYREREQLRAAGIVNPARIGYSITTPLESLSGSRKRAAPNDRDRTPEGYVNETPQDVQDLRTEVLELQIQADRAKKIRLEKEKETERLARQARQEWAELALAKANLERQIADEKTKSTTQEEEQNKLRKAKPNTMDAAVDQDTISNDDEGSG